jgi:hypothetical protein
VLAAGALVVVVVVCAVVGVAVVVVVVDVSVGAVCARLNGARAARVNPAASPIRVV